jgi:hypothetical protein
VSDTAYKPDDIQQLTFTEGAFIVHALENLGDTELLSTTMKFPDSQSVDRRRAIGSRAGKRQIHKPGRRPLAVDAAVATT